MLGQSRFAGAALYSPGTLLNNGRYKIEKRLNKGATAIVYAATDKQTGRQVALKVVQCGSNKVPVSVVRREVTLSSSVAHENMVQLLDVFAEGTELIIVWELIAGPDLLELLNEAHGRMNEPAAAFYFVQLLRGVLHMHAMGYCHRDIKPENCMVERASQRLKLIDFGLSKHLDSVATLGVGTPDYMPPEMVRSQVKAQQRSQQMRSAAAAAAPGSSLLPHGGRAPPYDAKKVDAWAMGVLLYLLVTGTYPFEDPAQPNNLAATIMNVQAGRCRPLPPAISAGCRAVIAGLLNPNPEARTRLEDLASCEWLTHSAAAHAAQLSHLGSRFEPTNPAWILPTQHAVNASAAANSSGFAEDPMGTAGLPARSNPAAAAAPAAPAAAAGGLQLSGPSSSLPTAAAAGYGNNAVQTDKQQQQHQQYHNDHHHQQHHFDAGSDTTEFMDVDEGLSTAAAGFGGNGSSSSSRPAAMSLAPEPAGSPATAAAAAGNGVALSFLTAAMESSSEGFSSHLRYGAAAAAAGQQAAAAAAAGAAVQHGAAGSGGMLPAGAAGAAAGGSRKGMGWLPEFMRRCI
uniref:Protein kinase domain-containing protein n=1 Tax=Tetradesmus obliquus TaxID=3088 RepID=A0A383VK64_TETOB|eukprot:jgi/Sobl393_1/4201/SZX65591.1